MSPQCQHLISISQQVAHWDITSWVFYTALALMHSVAAAPSTYKKFSCGSVRFERTLFTPRANRPADLLHTTWNTVSERGSPCLTPFFSLNGSYRASPDFDLLQELAYMLSPADTRC